MTSPVDVLLFRSEEKNNREKQMSKRGEKTGLTPEEREEAKAVIRDSIDRNYPNSALEAAKLESAGEAKRNQAK